MENPRQALADARAERDRILNFRSLSTADMRRLRDLETEIVQLKRDVARGPIEIAGPIAATRAAIAAVQQVS